MNCIGWVITNFSAIGTMSDQNPMNFKRRSRTVCQYLHKMHMDFLEDFHISSMPLFEHLFERVTT